MSHQVFVPFLKVTIFTIISWSTIKPSISEIKIFFTPFFSSSNSFFKDHRVLSRGSWTELQYRFVSVPLSIFPNYIGCYSILYRWLHVFHFDCVISTLVLDQTEIVENKLEKQQPTANRFCIGILFFLKLNKKIIPIEKVAAIG